LRCAVYEDFVLSVDFFGFNSLFEMPYVCNVAGSGGM